MIGYKNTISALLKKFNLKLVKYTYFEDLVSKNDKAFVLDFLKKIYLNSKKKNILNTLKYLSFSKSQLCQDLFVLNQLNFKRNGFFVEFGAANGVLHSNTFLLEKKFNWNGIVAEPAKKYYKSLLSNRKCNVSNKIIWKSSNLKLLFNETFQGLASTIDSFSLLDIHKSARITQNKKYLVTTISLNDLLDNFNAPRIIDYLSIDTEGSEFEILNNFNFKKYKFRVITCEIFSNKRKLNSLLYNHNYRQIFKDVSGFDAFYINTSI